MHPLSLSYYTVPELDPPETVAVAAATGCQHVGMRLLAGQPGGDLLPIMADAALRRATLRQLRDTGISVLDANTARLTPDTDMTGFLPFFEVAAELGARHVLATGDDPDESRLVERFARLCETAAAYGLAVQLEFVPWMSIPSLAAAALIVRAVNRPNMGIALDCLHFERSGGTLADIAALPAQWFAYVHLCDAPAVWSTDREALLHTAVKERLFPGDGGIDLVGLLRALPPDIPLALEIPTATLARSMNAKDRVTLAVQATRKVLAATAASKRSERA
jgi:sugar phosphate isomerase/epimerase